jgi:hypothetical protein
VISNWLSSIRSRKIKEIFILATYCNLL